MVLLYVIVLLWTASADLNIDSIPHIVMERESDNLWQVSEPHEANSCSLKEYVR